MDYKIYRSHLFKVSYFIVKSFLSISDTILGKLFIARIVYANLPLFFYYLKKILFKYPY